MTILLHVFFLCVTLILSALPQIQKCSLSDSDCVKNSAQTIIPILVAGIPELGTDVLDPMHVDLIKVDLSGLKLTMRNGDITGLKTTKIDKLSVDLAKKRIELDFHLDISLKSKYEASGNLLILPISGDGDLTIKLRNIQVQMTSLFDIVKENGKDTLKLKSYTYNYDVKDNAHFHLTNLFNGNKELSDTMLTFMNENWKLLTREFGTPVLEEPMAKIFKSMRIYLKSQPLEEIANV